jgi:hypothetical protein
LLGGDPGSDHDTGAVVPLARRSDHRTRNRWLAAAAAVALVALAVPLVRAMSDQSTSHLTAASTAESTPSSSVAPSVAADGRAGDPSSTTSAPSTLQAAAAAPSTPAPSTTVAIVPGDLGSASSPQELASLVETSQPQLLTAPPTAGQLDAVPPSTADPTGPAGCDAAVRSASPELGRLEVAASAHYRSLPVEVLVYVTTSPDGPSHRLVAVDPTSCAVVVDLTF